MLKLTPEIRVLDLDGSVTEQTKLLDQIGERARIIDLRDLGPSLRYLCGTSAVTRLERSLRGEDRHQLTFIGSGDFHHVTASLLRQFSEPLTLVVFDTHSDWDWRPPFPCCGSWVADALKMAHITRIISIGLADADIGGWRINLGHPQALRSGRVHFFPFDCSLSKTLQGPVRYRMVRGSDWTNLTEEIISQIVPGSVYVSIDKDCLCDEDAFTNWEVGGMRLEQLVSFVGQLRKSHDIIGADITGEYSPLKLKNPLLGAIASLDHPRKPAPSAEQLAKNEQTNASLLAALTEPL